jgi:hypothetical protein
VTTTKAKDYDALQLSAQELEGFLSRVKKSVEPSDYEIIQRAITTLREVGQLLEDKNATLARLLKLFFGSSTEKTQWTVQCPTCRRFRRQLYLLRRRIACRDCLGLSYPSRRFNKTRWLEEWRRRRSPEEEAGDSATAGTVAMAGDSVKNSGEDSTGGAGSSGTGRG